MLLHETDVSVRLSVYLFWFLANACRSTVVLPVYGMFDVRRTNRCPYYERRRKLRRTGRVNFVNVGTKHDTIGTFVRTFANRFRAANPFRARSRRAASWTIRTRIDPGMDHSWSVKNFTRQRYQRNKWTNVSTLTRGRRRSTVCTVLQ